MTISLPEAERTLLSGARLSWSEFGDARGGAIALDSAGKRRLFEFLRSQAPERVLSADEELFPELISAWMDDDYDPAADMVGNRITKRQQAT